MTTIHALPADHVDSTNRFLSVTLLDSEDHATQLLASSDELRRALLESGGVGRFNLCIGDDPKVRHTIARQVERGDVPGTFQHLTIKEIADSEVVRMDIVLVATALPAIVSAHRAQVIQRKRHLTVRGKFADLPEQLKVDLSGIPVDGSFRARDVPLPKSLQLVTPGDTELFNVRQLI